MRAGVPAWLDKARSLGPEFEPLVREAGGNLLLLKAQRSMELGNLSDAVLLWRQAEAGDRTALPLLHNLALGYERLQDFAKSARYWQRWNRERTAQGIGAGGPVFETEVLRRIAGCYVKAQLDADAADAYRSILAKMPGDSEAREALASLCMGAEHWEEALKHLECLQNSKPESSTRWTQIGIARMMIDDLSGATQAWRRAVELEPGNHAAHMHLTSALKERLRRMSPKNYPTEGLFLIQDTIRRLPNYYGPELVLAAYYFSLSYRKKAKEALERALKLAPDSYGAWSEALGLLFRFGTRSDCHRLGARLLREQPEQPGLLGAAGGNFLSHGDHQMAALLFQGAMKASNSAQVPLNIAKAYAEVGYPELALSYALRAEEREPQNPHALFLIGMIRLAQGDERQSAESLEAARALAAEQGDADLLEAIGDTEDLKHRQRNLFDLLDMGAALLERGNYRAGIGFRRVRFGAGRLPIGG